MSVVAQAMKRAEEREQKGLASFDQFPPSIPRDIFGAVSFGSLSLVQQVAKDPASIHSRDNSGNTPRMKNCLFSIDSAAFFDTATKKKKNESSFA